MAAILNFNAYKKSIEKKKAVIFNVLVGFYKDLNDSGQRNAYYISAKDKYNELIKGIEDINYYYDYIQKNIS